MLGGNAKRKKIYLEIVAAHFELFTASEEVKEASTVSLSSINHTLNATTVPTSASTSIITISALVAKYCYMVEALN